MTIEDESDPVRALCAIIVGTLPIDDVWAWLRDLDMDDDIDLSGKVLTDEQARACLVDYVNDPPAAADHCTMLVAGRMLAPHRAIGRRKEPR